MAFEIPSTALSQISDQSRRCIERLQKHQAETVDLSDRPNSKLAAVLVLLYEKSGELRVLLTTRSKSLRSHPGQTALPGGKVDDTDEGVVETAYREAFEEVGLPLQSPQMHTICVLRPFISSAKLLVTPVVSLLTNLSLLDNLKRSESEVDRIFDHPLEAILDPSIVAKEPLVEKGSEDWPYDTELYHPTDIQLPWLANSTYRMHRFRSTASPIKGLTAEILIMTATIAHNRDPIYQRYAPGQFTMFNDVLRVLDSEQHSNSSSRLGTPVGIATGVV
ncbi:NUDIX hydrolase domain-like protein [Abortiporus biennis]|nr:NUDIX hydrolase domain-like protein [Abortiporus biennis]